MADLIEIPAAMYGHRPARSVPTEARLRLEVRMPACVIRDLTVRSNQTHIPIARLVTEYVANGLKEG